MQKKTLLTLAEVKGINSWESKLHIFWHFARMLDLLHIPGAHIIPRNSRYFIDINSKILHASMKYSRSRENLNYRERQSAYTYSGQLGDTSAFFKNMYKDYLLVKTLL